MVSTVLEVRVTCRSPSWLVIVAGVPASAPFWADHALVAVQPYRFDPAVASDLKNNCPVWQLAGRVVPTCTGRVDGEEEKSTLLLCVRKSSCVCPNAQPAKTSAGRI